MPPSSSRPTRRPTSLVSASRSPAASASAACSFRHWMFSAWQNLYQMTGEAAATLIGLLFIVASLTAGRQHSPVHERGMQLFTTPTVFHLVSVLVISALTL